MNRILLIGNSGLQKQSQDGQSVKTRLYLKKMKDEGFDVNFIDLEFFLKHPFLTLRGIKNGIKECDRIVLLSAERGSKILIPFINRHNKRLNKPFVFPLIGTSVLHYSIDNLTNEDKNDFLLNGNYSLAKPKKRFLKQLPKITYILPETELLCGVFEKFYGLSNVRPLNNFREINLEYDLEKPLIHTPLKMVFLSRVMREKGIFELLEAVQSIIEEKHNVGLDIYGDLFLNNEDISLFNNYISNQNIHYYGKVNNDKVISIISNYDLLVFPTRFISEGTPGVIVESLLAGIPVLTSNFPQANLLLKDGYDSLFFEMFDKEDLKNKIIRIINNKVDLASLKNGAMKTGLKYTYESNRNSFLEFVCGKNEKSTNNNI